MSGGTTTRIIEQSEIDAAIASLCSLPTPELRRQWRRRYPTAPSRTSRDLIVRTLAWDLQAKALGGLKPAPKRQIRALRAAGRSARELAARPSPILKPGARLLREWNGQTHQVLVLEDSFEYAGQRYRSLSHIAKHITGAHWSGPRFFGLTGRVHIAGAAESRETQVNG